MELKEFIQKTYAEIYSAYLDLRRDHPEALKGSASNKYSVEFDVAIEISQEQKKGGKADIAALGLKIAGEKGDNEKTLSTTRVKFQMPIDYSQIDNENYRKLIEALYG